MSKQGKDFSSQIDDKVWQQFVADIKKLDKPEFPDLSAKKIKISKKPHESALPTSFRKMKDLVIGDIKAMDISTGTKLTKGKIRPEATLDLHGFTAKQSFIEVKNFIIDAYVKNLRCVRIITGKGRDKEDEAGFIHNTSVLKRELPLWLNHNEIRALIVSVTQAKQSDGGSGAFYVYIKRKR